MRGPLPFWVRHARILGEWRRLRHGAGMYTADLLSPDTGDVFGLIVGHRPNKSAWALPQTDGGGSGVAGHPRWSVPPRRHIAVSEQLIGSP